MGDENLRSLLVTLDPKARDDLRRVLIRDQADRDAISSRLMRYRRQNGQDWARHRRLPDDVPGCSATRRSVACRTVSRRGGDVTSHFGPFRITKVQITRVEHPSVQARKRKPAALRAVYKVYFEDAQGLDNHFFPYAKEEAQRRRGGFEPFYDFTYRATVKPRIAEEWTSAEIGKASWENE
jgi:hypothetical protein